MLRAQVGWKRQPPRSTIPADKTRDPCAKLPCASTLALYNPPPASPTIHHPHTHCFHPIHSPNLLPLAEDGRSKEGESSDGDRREEVQQPPAPDPQAGADQGLHRGRPGAVSRVSVFSRPRPPRLDRRS
ncbi:hypothetical protein Cni_G24809 [Canna indica]|uniref:Uncharacterized protein n=1 Tax=Canna indica TaxID=4628 RepID=A0AAQ3KYT7_9LILI|nr:hypothetical protein Cni_G24809 [Canna indica]